MTLQGYKLVDVKRELQALGLKQGTLNILPESCEVCGAVLDTTEALTELACKNTECIKNKALRLLKMLHMNGLNDYTEVECLEILELVPHHLPIQLFSIREVDLPETEEYALLRRLVRDLLPRKRMTAAEYLENTGLQGFTKEVTAKITSYQGKDLGTFIELLNTERLRELLQVESEHSIQVIALMQSIQYYRHIIIDSIKDVIIVDN